MIEYLRQFIPTFHRSPTPMEWSAIAAVVAIGCVALAIYFERLNTKEFQETQKALEFANTDDQAKKLAAEAVERRELAEKVTAELTAEVIVKIREALPHLVCAEVTRVTQYEIASALSDELVDKKIAQAIQRHITILQNQLFLTYGPTVNKCEEKIISLREQSLLLKADVGAVAGWVDDIKGRLRKLEKPPKKAKK